MFTQLVGVIIILGSQAVFIFRARRKYGSIKGAFLDMSYPRFASGKKIKEMDTTELNKLVRGFPLAGFLWDDFWVSLFGLVLTFLGLIVELI